MTLHLDTQQLATLREAARIGMFSPWLIGKHVYVTGNFTVGSTVMHYLVQANGGIRESILRDGLDVIVVGEGISENIMRAILRTKGDAVVVNEREFAIALTRTEWE